MPEVAEETHMRLAVAKTKKLFIGGEFPRSESGRSFPLNARETGKFYANIAQASRKDARNAVEVARKAFGSWSKKTAFNRGQILYRMAEMLEARANEISAELKLASQRQQRRKKLMPPLIVWSGIQAGAINFSSSSVTTTL